MALSEMSRPEDGRRYQVGVAVLRSFQAIAPIPPERYIAAGTFSRKWRKHPCISSVADDVLIASWSPVRTSHHFVSSQIILILIDITDILNH